MIDIPRSALVVVLACLFTACGPGGSKAQSLGEIPAMGLEPGWWATISVTATKGPRPTVEISVPTDLLFGYDESRLSEAAEAQLRSLAEKIAAEAAGPVSIAGATDLRGTDSYNYQLGLARSRATADGLLRAGVPDHLIGPVESLGEREPLPQCLQMNPDGSENADCLAVNRRVRITYVKR